ncbi:MAG: hypothetical protein DWQ06_05425 [Calditrichaeota bacterium]|nr:MAG: hypothetical protein DWQ06_05425 [Calditrichota bacterium]
MQNLESNLDLSFLLETEFSNPDQVLMVKKGEVLLKENQVNDKLYFILEGSITSFVYDSEGKKYKSFSAQKNMFVGVYSFFSGSSKSLTEVVTNEDSKFAFITYSQFQNSIKSSKYLLGKFISVILKELIFRHRQLQKIIIEKEQTFQKLLETEKMASLGQMAAGIAHELNNSIAVLKNNNEWLSKIIGEILKENNSENHHFFTEGFEKGRTLTSSEAKSKAKDFAKKYSISKDLARKFVEAGLTENDFAKIRNNIEKEVLAKHKNWEIGTAFYDISVASKQAAHVVQSVKTLGAKSSFREANQDVNESIHNALALLQSSLREINLKLELKPLNSIIANKGELVQIWTNLVKNACESLRNSGIQNPEIIIFSEQQKTSISVKIQDNGNGIPKEMLNQIFRPNVTTKIGGLSFGLGLGLTIVERLVNSYNGRISVQSVRGETIFEIKLPN